MALTKNTLASASYIVTPSNSTTVTATPVNNAIVADGKLVPSYRITNPGVFTVGTIQEGTITNSNDSNV